MSTGSLSKPELYLQRSEITDCYLFNLNFNHIIMSKSYNELKMDLEFAKVALDEAKKALEAYSDGYKYHVVLLSYGSRTNLTFKNEFGVKELIDEMYDGYDGLLNIYTTNQEFESNDMGCVSELVKMTDEEFDKLHLKRNVSKSEAFVNTLTGNLSID